MSNRTARTQWLGVRERPYDLRAQPIVTLALAAAIGILADRSVALPLGWMGGMLVAAGVLSVLSQRRVRFRHLRWLGVLVFVAVAFAMRSRIDQIDYENAGILRIATEDAQPILLRGVVRGDIQRRISKRAERNRKPSDGPSWQTLLTVDAIEVRSGDGWQPIDGGLRVTVEGDASTLKPGDRVELGGDLSAFSGPTNPGEKDFRRTARNRNWHARMMIEQVAAINVIELGRPTAGRVADSLAKAGERTLQSTLKGNQQALACALVVGRRESLDASFKDQLLETGTIHLLSVSGLHLGIVAGSLMSLGLVLGLGRLPQSMFIAAGCVLFAAITGGHPPVLRALMLVGTVLLANLINRRQWPFNTLALAAIVLLAMNPTDLTQVGVQLSFVAVATLMAASRAIGSDADGIAYAAAMESQLQSLVEASRALRYRIGSRRLRLIRNLLWLSLCVTLTTTPLVWLYFHVVTPVAVIANPLLGLPTAIALVTGLIAIVGGWIWQPLAIVPAACCDAALRVVNWLIGLMEAIPLGHFWLPSPPTWWVAFYYLALIGSFAIRRPLNRPRAFVVGSILWCLVAWCLGIAPSKLPRESLQATFVDVGHGTSVLIEMPTGENYLYDGGGLGNYDYRSSGIEDVIWSRGITRLDAVLLSHADSDHYNAMPGLLRRFQIDEVVTPPQLFLSPDPPIRQIFAQITRRGIPIREVSIEDQWVDAARSIAIHHPPKIPLPGNDNVNSLVIQLDYAGRSLVLPGDLEPPGTDFVIEQTRPEPGGVLMAPHHGSLSADSSAILQWARPSEVIVSGGSRAKRPEVQQMLQTYGSNVAVTARDGAIGVSIGTDKITIRRFRTQPW